MTLGIAALLRARHLPLVWGTALAVVVGFTVLDLATVDLPVGILTSTGSPSQPLGILQPPTLAVILAIAFFSDADHVEVGSVRRVALLHTLAVGATLAVVGAALRAQSAAGSSDGWRPTLVFYGYVALAMIGATLWGRIGWIVVPALLTLVMVAGVDAQQETAWWAWPIEPDLGRLWRSVLALWCLVAVSATLRALHGSSHRPVAD